MKVEKEGIGSPFFFNKKLYSGVYILITTSLM